jgi:hypothetical protein
MTNLAQIIHLFLLYVLNSFRENVIFITIYTLAFFGVVVVVGRSDLFQGRIEKTTTVDGFSAELGPPPVRADTDTNKLPKSHKDHLGAPAAIFVSESSLRTLNAPRFDFC